MTNSTSDHYYALPSGTRLLNFELRSTLGHGGFGITYKAFDTDLQQTVAIKEYLPNELAVRDANSSIRAKSENYRPNFEAGVKAFLEEARLLARFQHRNIVHVRRYFELHGTGYIVTDFIDGQSLTSRLSGAPTGPAEITMVLNGILDGLEILHNNAILHRDLKPSNVMLRADGTPVLIDFGAARDFTGRQTQSVTSIASSGYSPPEQYGVGGQQGPWTDLYAVGAIAYRCVTGDVPIDSLRRLRDDPLVPASRSAAGKYDARLLATIDRLLAVNEADRPSSVADVRALLSAPAPAATESAARVAMPAKANRSRWAIAAAALLVFVAGLGWFQWQRAETQKAETNRERTRQLVDAKFDRAALARLREACGTTCQPEVSNEIKRRLAVIDDEETRFNAAAQDVAKLQSYADNCEACLRRDAALQRANQLKADQTARDQAAAREREETRRRESEQALWDTARNQNRIEPYEQYLQAYPNGRYADVAQINLQRLKTAQAGQTVLTDPQRLAELSELLYELNYSPGSGNDAALRSAILDFESQNQLPQSGRPTQGLLVELRRAQPLRPWGAIVYARNLGKWGISWNNASRRQALDAARASCGTAQCTIEVSFFGTNCGALGAGDGVWSIVTRRTVDEAKQAIAAACRDKQKTCQTLASICAEGSGRFSTGN